MGPTLQAWPFFLLLILSFPMSSPTGNQRKSQSVFQSRIGPASMFQCFILRFSWQTCYVHCVHCWLLRWLVKALRDPFVWLQQRHYERSFLSQGFDRPWLQVMYLVMYLRWFPDILDVEISKSEWDTNLRDEGWGMANLNTFLLAVLRYDTG